MLVVVLRVLHDGQAQLLEITQTARTSGILPRSGKDGKQNRGEDRYDRNHDQKFDQSETGSRFSGSSAARWSDVLLFHFHWLPDQQKPCW